MCVGAEVGVGEVFDGVGLSEGVGEELGDGVGLCEGKEEGPINATKAETITHATTIKTKATTTILVIPDFE